MVSEIPYLALVKRGQNNHRHMDLCVTTLSQKYLAPHDKLPPDLRRHPCQMREDNVYCLCREHGHARAGALK